MNAPFIIPGLLPDELVDDPFAGGGTSEGIRQALGCDPDIAINHYAILEDGPRVSFTLEQQGRMCGNSVCPGMAKALVGANLREAPKLRARVPRRQTLPLLQAAE